MLPALNLIGAELGLVNENDVHFIITAFFLGMATGQLFVGPLSDRYGRKPVIHIGYTIFLLGCLVSMFAQSWSVMLLGRVLQGIGAAAPRIVTVALVRDQFEGRAMARILSIVMAVFIVVPIIAPALGQGLIYLSGWRATFLGLAVFSVIVSVWFYFRQPETLGISKRRSLQLKDISDGLFEIIKTRVALGYSLAAGLMFGAFIGYLGSAQKIYLDTFGVGDLFVMYFAIASVSLGMASLVNAQLVMHFGMRRLTRFALFSLTGISFVFWFILPIYEGVPPIWIFLVWKLSTFFFVGIVFGNLNALSLEPLGHMAGLGAAFVGSISLFISLPLAWVIGHFYDGTLFPLVVGFTLLGLASYGVAIWTDQDSGV